MPTKNTYTTIDEELDWMEEKCRQIMEFVNANPYELVQDRNIVTKKYYDSQGELSGEEYRLAATIEVQHKSLREAVKDYGLIMEVIKRLREKEDAKIEARGGAKVSAIAGRLNRK